MELQIARLARERHALARGDLLALGLSSSAISRRLADGRFSAIHSGVYCVGGAPPTRERRWAAAVLAGGPGAVLSHLSAAALWALAQVDPLVIDVTVPGRTRHRRGGIRIHRPRSLPSSQVTSHRRIPVTTPERTLIDCAEVVGSRSLERLLDEAYFLEYADRPSLELAVDRLPGRRGAARLRRVLARHDPGTTRTRSTLEEALLALIRHAGLPLPVVNAKLGPYTVDFLWADRRIVAETDGRAAHERAGARERDYARDAWLNSNGYRPLRFTWAQVHSRPDEVLGALTAALKENDPPIGGPLSREE